MGIYQKIISRMSIEKGWSGDKKYCALTADGTKYLLRISPVERAERKKRVTMVWSFMAVTAIYYVSS